MSYKWYEMALAELDEDQKSEMTDRLLEKFGPLEPENNEEDNMDINNMSAEELERLKERADKRLRELAALPTEPMEGSVVTFYKKFGNSYGKGYKYAAVHTPKGWSVTGRTTMNGITWEKLIAFVKSEEGSLANEAMLSLTLMGSYGPIR